ncbi:AAA family ATPase [Klebsiella pneumoniae]|nr:AAA family ATPase [Klebsiella pneumoniae]
MDCNPSFASYTELGVVASNRVIIPCTADAASIRGIKNLVKLIYGVSIDSTEQDEMFLDFNKEAKQSKIEFPSYIYSSKTDLEPTKATLQKHSSRTLKK